MRLHRTLVLTVALAATTILGTASTAAAAQYPVIYNFGYGIAVAATSPGAAPPGTNNFACQPTAAHPRPVVLVHGTFGNMTDSWQALSALLANRGYCVFALDYGGAPGNQIQATGDIPTSAAQLGAFVDRVLTATGAAKVDIVGHSQGGMMPRWYVKFLGGAAKVATLVGLAPSNHGTDLDGLTAIAAAYPGGAEAVLAGCPACSQQMVGSSFMAALNAGGDTVAGPSYTVIETQHDEVVTPYTSAFLSGPAVTNIVLQNVCVLDRTDHLGIIYDRVALALVLNALDPAHPAPVPCTLVLPGIGG